MTTIEERQYLLDNGETASVSVEAEGTVHAVNFNLDKQKKGPLGPGETVEVPKPGSGFSSLTLLFTFSGTGGKYTVTITGETGDPDTDVIDQGSFDIPATSAEYLFQ
jgi:hypothetical protein